jgi:hypothetical protein
MSMHSNTSELLLHQHISLSDNVALDLTPLIETRAIIQANSGGGKSWAIRRLLEQSHGKVQHIVIDVEGAFRTLREQYEYVLLGSETDEVDYPITVANAGQLARLFLETGTSAIVDLYEYSMSVRCQIVAVFLEALVNAPKSLWHDCLVVLDEAHVFCPEQGNPESKAAVEALCSRGRARGFCAVLATQRISKLGKDALAECNNKLIGRASLDRDMARSNAELEFPAKSQILKKLSPGEFYVFGPAFSVPDVQKIQIGPVLTTHPKAGSRRQMSSPPPPESLSNVLSLLRSLPLPEPDNGPEHSERSQTEHPGASTRGQDQRVSNSRRPPTSRKPETPRALQDPQVRAALAEKDTEIERLRQQIKQLQAIKISVDGMTVPVTDLPAVLQLDTLQTHVQQATIVIERAMSSTLSPQEEETPAHQETRDTRPAAQPTAPTLLSSEARLLNKLIAQVLALSPTEKLFFAWLIEHDGKTVSSQELADAVGVDVSAIWARQTIRLIKIPFITRSGKSKFRYQSAWSIYAQKYLTSLHDPQSTIQRFLQAAYGRRERI